MTEMSPEQRRGLARALFDTQVAPHWDWYQLPNLGDAGREAIRAATADAAAGSRAEDEALTQAIGDRMHGGPAGGMIADCMRVVSQVRPAAPEPAGLRYIANFTPEAWVNDNAIEVDDEGQPREWDCTAFASANLDYLDFMAAHYGRSLDDPFGVVDAEDRFRGDPAAPAWVRDWHGPYTIRVRREQ